MQRLTQLPTLKVDPSKKLSVNYMGKSYKGLANDTVATALYANGLRIFSRSIKYHRPRGLYSLDGECGNCLMEIAGIPNEPAEGTLLKDNMTVRPQNVVGSPEHDLMGFMDLMDWAMPAGFYYRYFHRPYKLWPFFLRQIRKTAGLGSVDPLSSLEGRFDEQYLHADVCVIGGGPAGILASLAAADQGLRVILLEARPWLGGVFDYRANEYSSGVTLFERARELARRIEVHPNVRVFSHTSVIGFYSNNHITAVHTGGDSDSFDKRYMEIRAQSVVTATGCTERPFIFKNNDRPGIMQIACAHRLVRTYGIIPGQSVVFSTGHDLGLEAALDLSRLGVNVICVADSRKNGQDARLLDLLTTEKISVLRGWVASRAHGKTVKKVTLSTTEGTNHLVFDCDVLVASAGLTPVLGPLYLAQAKMAYDSHTGYFLPRQMPPNVHAAGRMLGLNHPISIEASGHLAGLSAAVDCGAGVNDQIKEARERLESLPGPDKGSQLITAPGALKKCFVCFDEDVTTKHVYQACDMGFEHVEHVKRFTAAGTGPGQAGIPGHNLPLILSQYLGRTNGPQAPSKVRPPLTATLLAAYAGSGHELFKKTPAHESQESAGAVFHRIGNWKRARYFSDDLTCRTEIEAVRNNVGIIDVSTLGKFRIFGPDAVKALNRVYVGDMAGIQPGKVKYSVMCNDDGCVVDDGVVVKRAENDYYFTTSSNRADSTTEWIRYHSRYDGWDFNIVNLSDAFGAINLAGPNARSVLARLTDEDLSNKAFPFAGYRELMLERSVPARVMRLGFVGELSYEIHVPASFVQSIWEKILEAGKDMEIIPFGLEAQNVLRMEKAHIIIGQESEIRTTLHDLGLGPLWSRKKQRTKTVGAPALKFTEHQEGRMKLVGIEMDEPLRAPKDGSIIVDDTIRGHVCTARYSYTLKKSIGLALVENDLAREGMHLNIFEDGMGDERLHARVVPTPFYDPKGTRLRI